MEAGNLVDDTLQAIDFLVARTGHDHVVLIGHCGGAITASYAAARHPAVSGALLICPPTIEVGGAPDELDREGVAAVYLRQYLHRLGSKEAWLRLARGDSSYRTIVRLLTGKVRRSLDRLRQTLHPTSSEPRRPAFNERLRRALHAMHVDGKQLAVVFGDRDPELESFREFERDHALARIAATVLPDTSHGFVTEESIALLTAEVRRFIAQSRRPCPRAPRPLVLAGGVSGEASATEAPRTPW